MEEGLTIESFAEQMAQAAKPEQPQGDSGPADESLLGEGQSADEAQDPEAQAEGEEQSEQPPADSEPEKKVIKWTTANGESYEATEDELKAGYLRQRDYTQKTQEVADMARQSQADIQKQTQQYMTAVGQFHEGIALIGGLRTQIQNLKAQGMPAAELEVQLMRAEQQVGGAFQQFQRNLALQEQESTAKAVSAAEARLVEKFPKITRDDVQKVFGNVQKLSPSQATIDKIRTDPALAELAVYASRYMDLQAKKPEVDNKVRKAPPVAASPRPAVPSTKTDSVVKAINSRGNFSRDEFARLLSATSR